MDKLLSKFIGALVGSALCDAIGELSFRVGEPAALLEAIPAAWREKLERGAAIEELARRLFHVQKASPPVPD